MAGVNQLERDLIRMRQREGIELAKKEGKFKGRLKKYHKNHAGMNYAVKLYKEGDIVNQFVKLQMCLGPHYIESYRKGTVDELYQKSEIYNRK